MTNATIEAVLRLSGPERYAHFLAEVAGARRMWGLYQDGWALAQSSDGRRVLPVWPAPEYAARCAVDQWEGYAPCAIELDELFDRLLPSLEDTGTELGVFYTPQGRGILPGLDRVEHDLRAERAKIA